MISQLQKFAFVIPAKAEFQYFQDILDSNVRWYDGLAGLEIAFDGMNNAECGKHGTKIEITESSTLVNVRCLATRPVFFGSFHIINELLRARQTGKMRMAKVHETKNQYGINERLYG